MIRTQVSLEEKAYREAQREARRQGVSLAEFVRRALAVALAQAQRERATSSTAHAKPWMRYSGCVNSGDRNASQTVDEVVYGRERP